MIEISKELLSEVLGYKVDYIAGVGETYVGFHTEMGGTNINIYELAHKYKEWACKEGFILISYTKPYKDVEKKGYCQIHHTQDKNRENDKPFNCIYEVEAVIKACEWVLKEGL